MGIKNDDLKKIQVGDAKSTYKDSLTEAMTFLSQDERVIFVGQQIVFPGNPMSATLKNVSEDKMIEMPVAEEFQLGFCNGLALGGYRPISFYPRWDFLILAANQLCTHLDKLRYYSNGEDWVCRLRVVSSAMRWSCSGVGGMPCLCSVVWVVGMSPKSRF